MALIMKMDVAPTCVSVHRHQLVLWKVPLSIVGQLTAQKLRCAAAIFIELNGKARWSMAMPTRVDQTHAVRDGPVVPQHCELSRQT